MTDFEGIARRKIELHLAFWPEPKSLLGRTDTESPGKTESPEGLLEIKVCQFRMQSKEAYLNASDFRRELEHRQDLATNLESLRMQSSLCIQNC